MNISAALEQQPNNVKMSSMPVPGAGCHERKSCGKDLGSRHLRHTQEGPDSEHLPHVRFPMPDAAVCDLDIQGVGICTMLGKKLRSLFPLRPVRPM